VLVDNKKMAKSMNNFYTLKDIVKEIGIEKEEYVYR
jgi:cysteinyl-tRNA synthetase